MTVVRRAISCPSPDGGSRMSGPEVFRLPVFASFRVSPLPCPLHHPLRITHHPLASSSRMVWKVSPGVPRSRRWRLSLASTGSTWSRSIIADSIRPQELRSSRDSSLNVRDLWCSWARVWEDTSRLLFPVRWTRSACSCLHLRSICRDTNSTHRSQQVVPSTSFTAGMTRRCRPITASASRGNIDAHCIYWTAIIA